MDVYRNVAVPGDQDSPAGFFPGENVEGGEDVSLEWLSMFMEDCLSATPIYTMTPPPNPPPTTTTNNNPPPPIPKPMQHSAPKSPSQSSSKKRKTTQRAHHQAFQMVPIDPPLLPQTQWLAESELIFPKREHGDEEASALTLALAHAGYGGEEDDVMMGREEGSQEQRRCTHCLSHKTPQWRTGPKGPKTLCNACGVRFKSGRLLPEYRPAKSPTFVSYKHSNSHKKVMEMRMGLLSSPPKFD